MRTIYIRHFGYVKPFIEKIVTKKGLAIKEIAPDTAPKKNDLLIYTDVGAYRGVALFGQLLHFKKKKINRILLLYEPPVVLPYNYLRIMHLPFDKVYTWNDDLVDNKKYFKHHWPQLDEGRYREAAPFKKKKLLAIFCANKQPAFPFYPNSLYEKRIAAMRFFERKIPKQFHIYGRGWDKPVNLREKLFGARGFKNWKGFVEDKIGYLSKYKFCICYENMTGKRGYITEKIIDAFKARSVPIYWGCTNIDEYFPKEAYIDRRQFKNDAEVLSFIQNMKEDEYNRYIAAIDTFMKSKKADVWFQKKFTKMILENT